MKPPTSVFDLARMRRLDLLALYHRLHPADQGASFPGRMSKEWLVTAIATLHARLPPT